MGAKISILFLIVLVSMSDFWAAFEESKFFNSFSRSDLVISSKEEVFRKQPLINSML